VGLLFLAQDLEQDRLEFVVGQGLEVEPHHLAVQAEDGRVAGGEVQVRCPLLLHQIEQCVNACHAATSG
jgi:hypothetical protein